MPPTKPDKPGAKTPKKTNSGEPDKRVGPRPRPNLPKASTVHRGIETTCTRELCKQFEDLLTAGNYFQTVCGFLNVPERTAYQWRERGDAGELAEGADPTVWVDFAQTCTRAEHRAELSSVALLKQAGQPHMLPGNLLDPEGKPLPGMVPGDWRAVAEFLGRRYAGKWSKADRMNLGGQPDNPVTMAVALVDDARLAEIIARGRARNGDANGHGAGGQAANAGDSPADAAGEG